MKDSKKISYVSNFELVDIINAFNERNEFISKLWTWIATLSIFMLFTLHISEPTKQSQQNVFVGNISSNPMIISGNNDTSSSNNIMQNIGAIEEVKSPENLNDKKNLDKIMRVKIPIIDIEVPIEYVIVILIGIITALIIKWMEAYHRLMSFRENVIELLLPSKTIKLKNSDLNARSIFDGLVYSNTLSAWGAPFYLSNLKIIKFAMPLYFFLLKLGTIVVHFGLPAYSIIYALTSSLSSSYSVLISLFLVFLSFLSILSLFQGFITESIYCIKGVNRMSGLVFKRSIKL
jgi:hypothetical protein